MAVYDVLTVDHCFTTVIIINLISPVEFLSVFIWKKLQWLVRTCRNHAFQRGFILTKAGIHWFRWFQRAADDHFEHMRWASDPQRSGWFVGPGPVQWHGEPARDPGKSGEDTVPSVGKWCFSEDFRKMLIQLCDFIFWVFVVFDRILRFWANFGGKFTDKNWLAIVSAVCLLASLTKFDGIVSVDWHVTNMRTVYRSLLVVSDREKAILHVLFSSLLVSCIHVEPLEVCMESWKNPATMQRSSSLAVQVGVLV